METEISRRLLLVKAWRESESRSVVQSANGLRAMFEMPQRISKSYISVKRIVV